MGPKTWQVVKYERRALGPSTGRRTLGCGSSRAYPQGRVPGAGDWDQQHNKQGRRRLQVPLGAGLGETGRGTQSTGEVQALGPGMRGGPGTKHFQRACDNVDVARCRPGRVGGCTRSTMGEKKGGDGRK